MATLTKLHPTRDYRPYVPPKNHPRFGHQYDDLDTVDPYTFARIAFEQPEVQGVFPVWKKLVETPFYGVTTEGTKRDNVFQLQNEDVPIAGIVDAANAALAALNSQELARAKHDIDEEVWRKWSNPEVIIFDVGVRLEYLAEEKVELIRDLLQSSLSEEGWKKVQGAIQTNKFLGEICHARSVYNDKSYFFFVWGTPSVSEPWGYTFFGHHTCLNFFFVEQQMVLSPFFVGAEPNIVDKDPSNMIQICTREEEAGLALIKSLPKCQQEKAQIYKGLHDPAMPEGRWSPGDERHLGGAFQDNRIIPYEGVIATDMTPAQQEQIIHIIDSFVELLPWGARNARLQQCRKYMHETYFSWIGGYGDDDCFYYRVQSPVVLVEFDHHSGIVLLNPDPMKYHIHTVLRTPNGNDYGRELLRLYRERKTHGGSNGVSMDATS